LAEVKSANLALNILLGFGVWTIALRALALLNSAIASILSAIDYPLMLEIIRMNVAFLLSDQNYLRVNISHIC
jgi:hypothetical protein